MESRSDLGIRYWATRNCVDCGKAICRGAVRCRRCSTTARFRDPVFKERHRKSITGVSKTITKAVVEGRRGRVSWKKGLVGVQVAWNKGLKMSDEFRRKASISHTTTGTTPLDKKARQNVDYVEWRKRVLARDSYTCFRCARQSVNLTVHHKASFKLYESLRYDDDNGITLCKECHTFLHSKYGQEIHGIDYYNYFILLDCHAYA